MWILESNNCEAQEPVTGRGRAEPVAEAAGIHRLVMMARAYTNLSAMAVSRRKFLQACGHLRLALEYCERRDLDPRRLYLICYSARMKFEQGDWLRASSDAETVLGHPLTTPVARIPALRVLGHLRIWRGDPGAHTVLSEARALAGTIRELQRIGPLADVCTKAAWLHESPAFRAAAKQIEYHPKGEESGNY